jgi:hypothetical protein
MMYDEKSIFLFKILYQSHSLHVFFNINFHHWLQLALKVRQDHQLTHFIHATADVAYGGS